MRKLVIERAAVKHNLSVITEGPGTGKSTIAKELRKAPGFDPLKYLRTISKDGEKGARPLL